MDIEQQYIDEYASGFNDAAILAAHAPEMLSDIEPGNNAASDYFEGFFDAKEYYQEQEQQKELEDIAAIRQSNTKDKDLDR